MTLERFRRTFDRLSGWALASHGSALSRRYLAPGVGEIEGLENGLLGILLDLAMGVREGELDPLSADAAKVTAVVRLLGQLRPPDKPIDAAGACLSAVGLALAGNFPSASVVARETAGSGAQLSPVERWVVDVLASPGLWMPRVVPKALKIYADNLERALELGTEEAFSAASAELHVAGRALASAPNGGIDSYLLLLWLGVHAQVQRLSARRLLVGRGSLSDQYLRALAASGVRLLLPSQAAAVASGALLESVNNTLIAMPTSAGKSLLGELALVAAMSEGGNVAYLAPYRALARQLRDRMASRLERAGLRCVLRMGGYLSDTSDLAATGPTCLIATPEAFDSFIRSDTGLLDSFSCVAFDELHLLEQSPRGLRYEGVLARLRQRQGGGCGGRIVGLAPSLIDTARLQAWLGVAPAQVLRSEWQPAAKLIGFTSRGRHVRFYDAGWRGPARAREKAFNAELPLPYEEINLPNGYWAEAREQFQQSVSENILATAADQEERYGEPVLVLTGKREDARRLAGLMAQRYAVALAETHPARRLARECRSRLPEAVTMARCLEHGLAFHHAGLSSWLRSALEDLMAARDLRVVFATTTLAEGVDLPFRTVVMAGTRVYRHRWRQMPRILFANIAGRCGRAGQYLEGDTIIVDQPYEHDGLDEEERRIDWYVRNYAAPNDAPLRDAMESVTEWATEDAWRVLATEIESQFAAYVPYVPDTADQVGAFARSMLSGENHDIAARVTGIVNRLVDEQVGAGAYAALERGSPLRLTALGAATLSSGLSPRSATSLASWIAGFSESEDGSPGVRIRRQASIEWRPFLGGLARRIESDGMVSELEQSLEARIGYTGAGVSRTDVTNFILGWTSGLPLVDLLAVRFRTGHGQAGDDIRRWLRHEVADVPEAAEAGLEAIGLFCQSFVGETVAWIVRCAARLAASVGREDLVEAIVTDAVACELGVRTPEAATCLRQGCPIDRAKLDAILLHRQRMGEGRARIPLREWLDAHRVVVAGLPVGRHAKVSARDIDVLQEWANGVGG